MLPYIQVNTGQFYRGDLQPGDIVAVSEPPSPPLLRSLKTASIPGHGQSRPLLPPLRVQVLTSSPS
jgi:hypothetical protein